MIRARFTKGLRFRLTLTYVLFFTVLLGFLGIFFRETLGTIYYTRVQELLDEEWGAVKGYLRIDKGLIDWYYDYEDPEEALIVDRLRNIYLLTDAKGNILQISDKYRELGVDSPAEIQAVLQSPKPVWKRKKNAEGEEHLVRSGLLIDDNRQSFYVAIGRSLADGYRIVDQFTWYYSLLLPVMILSSCLLGWFVAGRALSPVNDLASSAERITGSNLTTRIPTRGVDDELDRLIDAFNQMIERLDSAFTQMRQFSTDVSHELRTPLTAIRGQLEVALFAAKTVEQYQEAIVNAMQDVERLSQTIRALLLLSQAESGQLSLKKQPVDLRALAGEIADQFQIPAEDAGVSLTTSLSGAATVLGDRIQLERLLSNLLSNALKYTPSGGFVRVAVRPMGDEVELAVEDSGVGIAADHLPHIFDRFYRVPNVDGGDSAPERGLGLGLSFVAWIVKAHNGRIDVESTVGKGSRFLVVLPAAPASDSREPREAATVAEKA